MPQLQNVWFSYWKYTLQADLTSWKYKVPWHRFHIFWSATFCDHAIYQRFQDTKEEHLTSKLVDFDQCVGVQLDPYAQSKRISDYKIQGLFLSQTQCFICFITIHHLVLYIWRSCAPGRILLANPKASTRFQLRDWPRPQELGTQRACPDGQVQFAQSESGQGWLMPIQRGVSHWLFTKFP
jgi:hypothetical protein